MAGIWEEVQMFCSIFGCGYLYRSLYCTVLKSVGLCSLGYKSQEVFFTTQIGIWAIQRYLLRRPKTKTDSNQLMFPPSGDYVGKLAPNDVAVVPPLVAVEQVTGDSKRIKAFWQLTFASRSTPARSEIWPIGCWFNLFTSGTLTTPCAVIFFF